MVIHCIWFIFAQWCVQSVHFCSLAAVQSVKYSTCIRSVASFLAFSMSTVVDSSLLPFNIQINTIQQIIKAPVGY
jgi:hypothetical protein